MMVDLGEWVDFDPESAGVTELVYYPVLQKILEENASEEDIKDAIHKNIHELIPKHITKEDIFASINYNMHLEYGIGHDDDIDHLATVVSVRSENCCRTSTVSVFPDWRESFVKE